LQESFKAILEALEKPILKDQNDAQLSLILCECRLVYSNPEMFKWVKDNYTKHVFELHTKIRTEAKSEELRNAVTDLFSLLN